MNTIQTADTGTRRSDTRTYCRAAGSNRRSTRQIKGKPGQAQR